MKSYEPVKVRYIPERADPSDEPHRENRKTGEAGERYG